MGCVNGTCTGTVRVQSETSPLWDVVASVVTATQVSSVERFYVVNFLLRYLGLSWPGCSAVSKPDVCATCEAVVIVTEQVSAVPSSERMRWNGDKCSRRETIQCVVGETCTGFWSVAEGRT